MLMSKIKTNSVIWLKIIQRRNRLELEVTSNHENWYLQSQEKKSKANAKIESSDVTDEFYEFIEIRFQNKLRRREIIQMDNLLWFEYRIYSNTSRVLYFS